METIETLKKYINQNSCAIYQHEQIYTSAKKGIAPILDFIESQQDFNGAIIADKIVGKAAASLFVKMGIKEVYGEVMSIKGMETLEKYHIPYTYQTKVEKIINREGTDICPMEKTVQNIDDIETAYLALVNKVKELQSKNNSIYDSLRHSK